MRERARLLREPPHASDAGAFEVGDVARHFAKREDLGEEVDPLAFEAVREHCRIVCRM